MAGAGATNDWFGDSPCLKDSAVSLVEIHMSTVALHQIREVSFGRNDFALKLSIGWVHNVGVDGDSTIRPNAQEATVEKAMQVLSKNDPVAWIARPAFCVGMQVRGIQYFGDVACRNRAFQTIPIHNGLAEFLLIGARFTHHPASFPILCGARSGSARNSCAIRFLDVKPELIRTEAFENYDIANFRNTENGRIQLASVPEEAAEAVSIVVSGWNVCVFADVVPSQGDESCC